MKPTTNIKNKLYKDKPEKEQLICFIIYFLLIIIISRSLGMSNKICAIKYVHNGNVCASDPSQSPTASPEVLSRIFCRQTRGPRRSADCSSGARASARPGSWGT